MFLAGMECFFPLGTHGYQMRYSTQSVVAMSRSNVIFCVLRFSYLASFRACKICDAASQMDLISRRASKKLDDFLVGHDLPQIYRARHLLIFPWTMVSVPIIICSLSPASYLVANRSGGIDPIDMHIMMSWQTAVHSVPVSVRSRLRAMVDTADVLPWVAAIDEHVKICWISSYYLH
jgi:hypothetical protein